MEERSQDPLVAALQRLCDREGGYAKVADEIGANDQTIYQIVTKRRDWKTGKPKGVGPKLRELLGARYPDWMSLAEARPSDPPPLVAFSRSRPVAPPAPAAREVVEALGSLLSGVGEPTRRGVMGVLSGLVEDPGQAALLGRQVEALLEAGKP